MSMLKTTSAALLALTFIETGQRAPRFAEVFDVSHFIKGNIHTHTTRSDGGDAPEEVVAWYRDHGYGFVALTDHNVRSTPADFTRFESDRFAVIAGEEISMTGAGRQVHMNGLCTQRTIGGGAFYSAAEALAWASGEVTAQGGVALINHPNFDHALAIDDPSEVRGAALLEVASGHPYVFSEGIDGRPSHEAVWDWALAHGHRFAAVAVDDTHHLHGPADPPAYPGKGWVEVFGEHIDQQSICAALRAGHLYASTGAELTRIRVTETSYAVWPRSTAEVTFIACGGKLLAREIVSEGAVARYDLHGDETCVRARVESDGRRAWTPAVFVLR